MAIKAHKLNGLHLSLAQPARPVKKAIRGKDFKIVKTFPSIDKMNGDGFSDGDFTMIASDVSDPYDGRLYVWNGTSFTYIADLSGSQGIKGDTGKTGEKRRPRRTR